MKTSNMVNEPDPSLRWTNVHHMEAFLATCDVPLLKLNKHTVQSGHTWYLRDVKELGGP